MKTITEIKDEIAKSEGFRDWRNYYLYCSASTDEVISMIAIAFAAEALKEASERANLEPNGMALQVDKQSILDIIEELK